MLKNYIMVALRTLMKHKGYAFINIAGLASGIACCLLILFYVQDELSYDTFHRDAGRIYRFDREFTEGAPIHFPWTPLPLVPALQAEYPGMETMRLSNNGQWSLIRWGERRFQEKRIYWADSNFFSFFSFPLKVGDPRTVLNKPQSIVITEEMATKYFGDTDPLGKVINIDNTFDVTVTGIMRDVPTNTHFHPDFLASFSTRYPFIAPARFQSWSNNFLYTYFRLPPGYTEERFRADMPRFIQARAAQPHKNTLLNFIAMRDIHLHSHLDGELEPNGDIASVYLFSAVAVFIMLLACINYMNLATARASLRMKEIGIRKTLGAMRRTLIGQFMGEALVFSTLALLVGVTLSEILLPTFNSLSGKTLSGSVLLDPGRAGWALLIGVLAGLLSGIYPAFVLSSLRPVQVLKGTGGSPALSGRRLRQILVVTQFAVSIALIICTLVVRDQMSFVRNKNLGMDKDQVLLVSIPDTVVSGQFETIKDLFRSVPGVAGVGGSGITPASPLVNSSEFPPAFAVTGDQARGNAQATAQQWIFRFVSVDDEFFQALNIPLVAGRRFSASLPGDRKAFIINELALQRYGWRTPEEALGKEIIGAFGSPFETRGPVIGVVKDFHFESLHEPLKAMIFVYTPRGMGSFIVKIAGRNVRETYAALEDQWRRIAPQWPFVTSFLDADLDALYRADERLGSIFGAFSLFGIFIACLGLLGLGAFVIEQRTKEIGVRKVLGARVGQIVLLLSKDFMLLVFAAFLLASPVAYVVMVRWLESYAYRVPISPLLFLTAGGLALLIAWCTVSYLSLRAALADPVRSLRYE